MGVLYNCVCQSCQHSTKLALGSGMLGARQVVAICQFCGEFGMNNFSCPEHLDTALEKEDTLNHEVAQKLACPACHQTGNISYHINGLWD